MILFHSYNNIIIAVHYFILFNSWFYWKLRKYMEYRLLLIIEIICSRTTYNIPFRERLGSRNYQDCEPTINLTTTIFICYRHNIVLSYYIYMKIVRPKTVVYIIIILIFFWKSVLRNSRNHASHHNIRHLLRRMVIYFTELEF